MGRRKKKPAAAAAEAERKKDISLLLLEFLDLLVSLFELGGFYDDNDNHDDDDARRQLVSSLESLSGSLMKLHHQQQQQDDAKPSLSSTSAVTMENSSSMILLQVEESLVAIRQHITLFLESIADDRTEVIHVKREIETMVIADKSKHEEVSIISWSLLSNRLATSLLSRLTVEERLVRNLQQSLDSFYDDRSSNERPGRSGASSSLGGTETSSFFWKSKAEFIQRTVDGLNQSRRKLTNSREFQEAASILGRLVASSSSSSSPSYSTTAPSATTRLTKLIGTSVLVANPTKDWTAPTKQSNTASFPIRQRLYNSTATTPMDTLRDFCAASSIRDRSFGANTTTCLLLVGPEGSGKTYSCNEMERFVDTFDSKATGAIHVIRPCFPMDFLGRSVGETEDAILSLYGAIMACRQTGPTLLLLDDVDHLFADSSDDRSNSSGMDDDDTGTSRRLGNQHLSLRAQATFKEIMELLRRHEYCTASTTTYSTTSLDGTRRFPILIIGTARRNIDDSTTALFDNVFFLESPNDIQRRNAIMQYLGIDLPDMASNMSREEEEDEQIEALLSSLAQATVGKSYAELAQCCRQAIHQAALVLQEPSVTSQDERSSQHQAQPDRIVVLRILRDQLQHKTPESLREAVVHDMVDLCIWTARDLKNRNNSTDTNSNGTPTSTSNDTAGMKMTGTDAFNLGLYGSIEAAWKELQHSIVIPLCQRRELAELLDRNGTTSPKILSGGLVLTGVPGTGKTMLAYETARFATQLLPSIKLLDVSCTSLIHKEVGGSERALHQLFAAARKATPCILLMDGIDNIAAVRGNDATTEGTMDRVLSTLLVELDGVDDNDGGLGSSHDPNQGIAVIGITHNVNWIDPALLRPGRLAKVVELHLPDYGTRQRIVQRELESIASKVVLAGHDAELNLDESNATNATSGTFIATTIARATGGMAASSVVAICNDLKLWLARDGGYSGSNDKSNHVDGTSVIELRRGTIDYLVQLRK